LKLNNFLTGDPSEAMSA